MTPAGVAYSCIQHTGQSRDSTLIDTLSLHLHHPSNLPEALRPLRTKPHKSTPCSFIARALTLPVPDDTSYMLTPRGGQMSSDPCHALCCGICATNGRMFPWQILFSLVHLTFVHRPIECPELMHRSSLSVEPSQHTKFISRAQKQIFNTVLVTPPVRSLRVSLESRISFALATLIHIGPPFQPIRRCHLLRTVAI